MRKIAVVTGSRAEYWLLKPLISLLTVSDQLNLFVTGEHLRGPGLERIHQDSYTVTQTVDCLSEDDSYLGMAKAIADGTLNFANTFHEHQPNIIVLLGDRFETLAAATAAYSLKIPIAHIHGGEITQGALDDGFRHAISKMASLHFVSHPVYKERLIRMGEQPAKIYCVGALGLDNVTQFTPNINCNAFQKYPMLKNNDYFLLTLHSSTLSEGNTVNQAEQIISAIDRFPDYKIVITQSNNDPEGLQLNQIWQTLSQNQPDRIIFVPTLGEDYLQVAYFSKLVLGNSSSGILEIPYLNKPVLNIGNRQMGRIFPQGVYQVEFNADQITNTISEILKNYTQSEQIYGEPGKISQKIMDTLQTIALEKLVYKEFYDAK